MYGNVLVLCLLLQLLHGLLRSALASAANDHLGSSKEQNLGSEVAKTGVSSLFVIPVQRMYSNEGGFLRHVLLLQGCRSVLNTIPMHHARAQGVTKTFQ